MKVLVVGAAGSSAGKVVPELVRRGVEVRGLVRDESRRGVARQAGATETVVADLADRDAIAEAARGVDGVFAVIPAFAEDEAALGVNIVRAAESAGVRKVVFSSVYHPSLRALSNHRDKQPAEAALYDSDLVFVVLQPAMFMAQLDGAWRSARQDAVISGPYSADSSMAYVDYREVAEIAAQAFVGDRLDYGTFELSAPGMFTRHDLARLIAKRLGVEVRAEEMDFEEMAERSGMPAGPMRAGLATMMAHYDAHGFHGGNGLILETLLGRPATTVADYIDELAAVTPRTTHRRSS